MAAPKKRSISRSGRKVVYRKSLTFDCPDREYKTLLRLSGFTGSSPLGEMAVSIRVKSSKTTRPTK